MTEAVETLRLAAIADPAGLDFRVDKAAVNKLASANIAFSVLSYLIKTLEIEKNGRYIIIATPCVLDGILTYARVQDISTENLLTIGLFCDLTMNQNFIEYIGRVYGEAEESIAALDYRNKLAGGWPGNMRITFSNGRMIEIDVV